MSNQEKYKKAFSVLQASGSTLAEVETMANLKKRHNMRTAVAAAVACLVVIGGSTTAYAANVGGIQRTVQMWFNGDQTDVTVEFDGEGNYTSTYTDANGETHEGGGGGVAIDAFGRERPLTEEELMTEMANHMDVNYADDGTVTLYYQDQAIDITDKFEDGYCYIEVQGQEGTLYVVVKYQDGLAFSSIKYPEM